MPMEILSMNFSSGIFWAFMILSFGAGYLVSGMFTRNKFKSELDKCRLEKSMLLNNVNNVPGELNSPNPIKAVQTRGRSGLAVKVPEVNMPQKKIITARLNFDRIGEATEELSNDLKMIDGIGPFIENKLNTIGVYTFLQISRLEKEDIDIITELLEFFPGRIERDNWKQQAAKLAKKYPVTREDQ